MMEWLRLEGAAGGGSSLLPDAQLASRLEHIAQVLVHPGMRTPSLGKSDVHSFRRWWQALRSVWGGEIPGVTPGWLCLNQAGLGGSWGHPPSLPDPGFCLRLISQLMEKLSVTFC